MFAAMLDSGDLIAKLTSEMDSPPSTTHRKWYYTTLDQELNIDRNHAGWRPSWILIMGQVAPFGNPANNYGSYAAYHVQNILESAKKLTIVLIDPLNYICKLY